jgi:acyl-coenzyme A thioesterase PaaI-like protein
LAVHTLETTEPRMTLAEARVWLTGLVPSADRLRLEAVDGPRVVCTAGPDGLELRPDLGAISGPALFWAVDLTGFVAVSVLLGPSPAIVLAHGDISFLHPAQPGTLRVSAEVVSLASRSAVVTAQAVDQSGHLVAVSTLHFALPSRATRGFPLGAQADAAAT